MTGRLIVGSLLAAGLGSGCASSTSLPSTASPVPSRPVSQEESFAAATKGLRGTTNWGDVESQMAAHVTRHPEDGLAWYNLGVARVQQGRVNEAAEAYRRAIDYGGPTTARLNLASLELERGRVDTAEVLLRDLVAAEPKRVSARVSLGRIALRDGRLDAAREAGIEALGQAPGHVPAYCLLGEVALAAKKLNRVRLLVAQGLKLDAEVGCLHALLGEASLAERDDSAAVQHFSQAVAKDPSLAPARFRLGLVALRHRDYQRAAEAFSTVQAQAPSAEALVNLGVAKKGLGEFEAAETAYLEALRLDGIDAGLVHYNLGVLYLRHLERLAEAQRAFKTYLKSSDGPDKEVFAWLEEIEVRLQLEEEERARAETEAREAEIERMRQEEEARQKAALEAEVEASKARARAAGEPEDPELAPTPETPPDAAGPSRRAPKKRKRRNVRRSAPAEPEPVDPPSDFE